MDWREFLITSTRHLKKSPCHLFYAWSWCSWTTFARLGDDAGYWTAPLPEEKDLLEVYVADGGSWSQPVRYSDIAHIILPARFFWESTMDGSSGYHIQDIVGISRVLNQCNISHRITDIILEIKNY